MLFLMAQVDIAKRHSVKTKHCHGQKAQYHIDQRDRTGDGGRRAPGQQSDQKTEQGVGQMDGNAVVGFQQKSG